VDADEAKALVFALCHEAASLLTALRFHAAAPAGPDGDTALRTVVPPLGARVGALLALVRPLLDGAGEDRPATDTAQLLRRVERELVDAGVESIALEIEDGLPPARCDPELLRSLLITRALAVVEPGEAPVRLSLATARCARGILVRIEDDAPPGSDGSAPRGVALVERIARRVLVAHAGEVATERLPTGGATRFELEAL